MNLFSALSPCKSRTEKITQRVVIARFLNVNGQIGLSLCPKETAELKCDHIFTYMEGSHPLLSFSLQAIFLCALYHLRTIPHSPTKYPDAQALGLEIRLGISLAHFSLQRVKTRDKCAPTIRDSWRPFRDASFIQKQVRF